jgi:hypothetical protein
MRCIDYHVGGGGGGGRLGEKNRGGKSLVGGPPDTVPVDTI